MSSAASYAITLAAVAVAFAGRWLLDPYLGDQLPYPTFFVAVIVATWVGGFRPALLATALGFLLALYFFLPPRYSFAVSLGPHLLGLAMYLMVSLAIASFGEERHRAARVLAEQKERLRTTLASIGDAVITTDVDGRITNMNAVAESLTAWANAEVMGKALDSVFCIVNEETRAPVPNPATRALREGVIVGLANHTVLIAKDGTERPIDDSAAPIRCKEGEIVGCVLVFRDVTERRRAELVLKESEARKTAMFESALDCIISMTHEGNISEFNAAAERTFGHRREDVMGQELAELIIPPAFRERHRKGMARYLETGDGAVLNKRLELVALRANGTEFPVELTVIRLPVDGPPLFSAYLRDITDRRRVEKALNESEERFRTLTDNMPQLAWIADAGTDGQVHWFNKAWFEYTGTTLEQMTGSGWHLVHHPDYAERVIQKFEHHVREGLDWEDTFPLRGKDGGYRWFLSRMNVIRDPSGRVARIFGTNTDITEQRESAEALRIVSAELSEANNRKDEFLATLAHELRNPLAPILNGLRVMKLSRDNVAVIDESRAVMERQLGQMVRLIDDLMDVSRISRGMITLKREHIDLRTALRHAVETSRPLIEASGHELIVEDSAEPIMVDGDLARLAQVFANLLNNAAKYTEKGGRIWLTVERRPNAAVVRVKDTGVGIPQDMLPRIFEMFTQVDRSLENSQGGLGLGLWLVHSLVKLHSGSIEVESGGRGMGSQFTVHLAVVHNPDAQPTSESTGSVTSPAPRRILVADDNVDSASTLAMLLGMMGHDVRTANDGVQAIELAQAFHPDFILLDIGMPKLNGYEACRRIRAEPWGKDIVLIALTGWGKAEDKRKSAEAGFDHHLVKPVDAEALEQLLAKENNKKV